MFKFDESNKNWWAYLAAKSFKQKINSDNHCDNTVKMTASNGFFFKDLLKFYQIKKYKSKTFNICILSLDV